MTALALLVLALTTHRVTRFVTTDTLTTRPREWLRAKVVTQFSRSVNGTQEVKFDVSAKANPLLKFIFKLTNCHWCLSVWAGSGSLAMWHFQGGWFQWVAYALSMSSVASWAHERLG